MAGLSNIKIQVKKRSNVIDPNQVWESLTLRGSIKDIWGSQKEALAEWHAHRSESDIQIDMTTGGGKTLVGLLAGQSLVNETAGKVLYVCPTNQLVEQTVRRAAECGISVADYRAGEWTNPEVFDEGRGICVTSYAALFTAWSKFADLDLSGVVFDDAHVASNSIRSQYTLRIPSKHAAFHPLCKLFASYFNRAGLSHRLDEAMAGDWRALLFVPMFEMWPNAQQISEILRDKKVGNVEGTTSTKFAWEQVKDHLDICVMLLSGVGIEIAPPVIPLHRVPYFKPNVRRLYLTATMPSPADFIRTFGVTTARRIQPGGKAGDAQRQFLFMPGEDDQQRASALQLISKVKACIITPSGRAAEAWKDHGAIFDGASGHAGIERFAASKDPEKLILVARYDGVDLPGDACRVLVLDRVPGGASLFDRFLDESLAIAPMRAMRTATRVMQAIGRIFRSNTDHGAVVICGSDLHRWLRDPKNQAYLPPLIQRQLQLGASLRDLVDHSRCTFEDLLDGVLKGTKAWDDIYKDTIEQFDVTKLLAPPPWLVEMAAGEQLAYSKLWEGNHVEAAAAYGKLAERAAPYELRLKAWFRHWEGRAAQRTDEAAAWRAYTDAANVRAELGRPKTSGKSAIVAAAAPTPSAQATRIAEVLAKSRAKIVGQVEAAAAALVNGSPTKPTEAACQELGVFLGFASTRPEQEDGTGPDVLWRCPEIGRGVALELKTDKKSTSQYTKKDDIGQFQDHVNYLAKKYQKELFKLRIVGPRIAVSPESNPPATLAVLEVQELQALAARVADMYRLLLSAEGTEDTATMAQRWLDQWGLGWPVVIEALPAVLATDLQSLPPDAA